MSEEQRAEQSRINGAQGQGPTSEEGKAISCQNATKHNLSGKTFILLEGERLEDYEELRDALLHRHQPRDAYERHLVETIAELEWKTARACRIEAESIGYEANRWKEGVTRAAGTPGFETKQNGYGRYISNFRLNIKRIKQDLVEARSNSSAGILPVAKEEITKRTQDTVRGAGVSPAKEEPAEPKCPRATEPQKEEISERTQESAPTEPSRLAPHASRLDSHTNNKQPTRQLPAKPQRTPPFPLYVADEARSRDFLKRMKAAQDDSQ